MKTYKVYGFVPINPRFVTIEENIEAANIKDAIIKFEDNIICDSGHILNETKSNLKLDLSNISVKSVKEVEDVTIV